MGTVALSSLDLHSGVQLHDHVQCTTLHSTVQINEVEALWTQARTSAKGMHNGSHDHG
jgi:hypothetical protein